MGSEADSQLDRAIAERGAVIAWLHRRSRMCLDEVQWHRPIRRVWLRHLAAAFRAAALSIDERVHLAPTIGDESAALRRAQAKTSSASDAVGNGFFLETGKLHPSYTIPMTLTCPSCGARHIDEAEFAEVPHHTHACQGCGMVWRPAKVNTHGVRFLPGYSNAHPIPGDSPCK